MWHDVFSFIRLTGWLLQNVGVAPIGFATPPKAPARQTEKIIVPLEDVIKTFDTNPHGMRWYWLITFIHTYIYLTYIVYDFVCTLLLVSRPFIYRVVFYTQKDAQKGPSSSPTLIPAESISGASFLPLSQGQPPEAYCPLAVRGFAEAKLKQEYTRTKDLRSIFLGKNDIM